MIMKTRDFLKQLHKDQIVAAIREAEQKTSGEIRVFVSHKSIDDPVAAAQAEFARLDMMKTRERNGVLFFVAPNVRKFAVLGDAGVHQRCGDEFWRELTNEISGHFKSLRFTEGIVHGIRKAGQLLAQHFPKRSDDKNELSDDVAHD